MQMEVCSLQRSKCVHCGTDNSIQLEKSFVPFGITTCDYATQNTKSLV